MDQLSATIPEAENASTPTIELRPGPVALAGRIVLDAAEPNDAVAALMVGETVLGPLRLTKDEAPGREGGTALQFSAADFGLAAFARICGLSDLSIMVEGAAGPVRQFIPDAVSSTSPFSPLGTRLSAGPSNARLADLWFESGRRLVLRFEATSKVGKTIDVYQGGTGLPLILIVPEQPICGLTPALDVPLINPFAPLLLVVKGEDGQIDAIDLIPFPSLVRGGLHHPELLIASNGADEVSVAAHLSRDLLAGWIERLDQSARCISTIEIDPAVHTGLEPILNEDLLRWLSETFGVALQLAKGGSEVPGFIREKIAELPSDGGSRGHILHLPACSVPTIAALVAVFPGDAASSTLAGGTAVANWSQRGPVWSVWIPPFGDTLEQLQPAGAQRFAPALTIRGRSVASEPANNIVLRFPIAIVLREPPTRVGSDSPFEISPEVGELLQKAKSAGKCAVDAVIFAESGVENQLALLESLARQEGIEVNHLVLCGRAGSAAPEVADALASLFDGRAEIAELAPNAGRLEQLVAVRERLASEKILLLGGTTVLTDARTASTLCRMLDVPEVASAGCLLRAANPKMTPVLAGYSFSGINLLGTPTAAFDVIDPSVWLAPATYAVIANALSMLVTRREAIDRIQAAGSTGVRPENDDLLLGIQLIEQGGINVCTTMVSAFVPPPVTRGSLMSLSVPYRLSPETLAKIGESATIVQRAA